MDPSDFDASQIDALFELMVIAAAADDEVGAEEKKELAENLEALTKGRLPAGGFEAAFAQALGLLAMEGRDARLVTVKQRLGGPERCEAALAAAIRVFAVDGVVRTSEREAILEIAEALGVDTDRAADLVRSLA